MADRLVTVSITCWVYGVAHEVTEEEVATGRRLDDRRYRAICGYRFVWRPAALVMPTGRPVPRSRLRVAATRAQWLAPPSSAVMTANLRRYREGADHATAATHLQEASALAARMDTEVGTWANLLFGPTNVGIWRTTVAVELGEHGQALEAAKTVHPELLSSPVRQAQFWVEVGRALVAEKKTREEGLQVLLRAERLAPQWVRTDLFVREAVADLLRRARGDAGGRELRGLAWRLGIAPIG